MGKGSSSAPPTADPSATIKQSQVSNTATAIANQRLNQTDQITPYGNLTYQETGGGYDSANTWVPQFTATTTLSPAQQRLYESQLGVSQGTSDLANAYVGRIKQSTATPFDYVGLPEAPTTAGMPTYDNDYRKKTYETMLQREQPQMDRDRASYEQRLADQGIGIEDAAYRPAWDQFDRGVNDFRLGADLQSGQEARSDYGTAMQGFTTKYDYDANTRDRAIQERLNLRNQPINEVSALLGTGPGVQNPNFVNTPQTQIQPTDVAGIYGNADQAKMQAWGTQEKGAQGSQSGMMAGLFGLGSAAIIAV